VEADDLLGNRASRFGLIVFEKSVDGPSKVSEGPQPVASFEARIPGTVEQDPTGPWRSLLGLVLEVFQLLLRASAGRDGEE